MQVLNDCGGICVVCADTIVTFIKLFRVFLRSASLTHPPPPPHTHTPTGWCYTADLRELNFSSINCTTQKDHRAFTDNIVSIVFGYELWVYIAFVTLPVLYTTLFCYMKFKVLARCFDLCQIL